MGEEIVDTPRTVPRAILTAAVLIAGLPVEVGGETINRNCASGLCAINNAAMSVMSGCEDVQIAGGVEQRGGELVRAAVAPDLEHGLVCL